MQYMMSPFLNKKPMDKSEFLLISNKLIYLSGTVSETLDLGILK